MSRAGAAALGLALALGCAEEPRPRAGIETRVSVDRSEARVGDRVAVTVAIETPPGYRVELPGPPIARAFETERVESLDPLRSPGALTHRLRWTLRAREVGDRELPALQVPLVRPDGTVQPLVVGGVPLPVRSVMAELPERRAVFDIRPPPPLAPSRLAAWLGGAAVLAALAGLGVWALRRRRAPEPAPDARELARAALAALERALLDRAGRLEPRELASVLAAPLWELVATRFGVATEAATPAELPPDVDPELRAALHALECARFERAPAREPVVAAGARARLALEAWAAETADA